MIRRETRQPIECRFFDRVRSVEGMPASRDALDKKPATPTEEVRAPTLLSQ